MNKTRRLLAALAALALALALPGGAVPAKADSGGETGLSIILDRGTKASDGTWSIRRDVNSVLRFVFRGTARAERYTAVLTFPDGSTRDFETGTMTLTVPQADLPAGKYTLAVTAWISGAGAGPATMQLTLEDGESAGEPAETGETEPPAGTESPDPQANPEGTQQDGADDGSGIGSGGTGGSKKPAGRVSTGSTKKANAVTPGKALTSAHAKGSGQVLPYGTVQLAIGTGTMEILQVGGEELALSCGGHAFRGKIQGDRLVLTREAGDEAEEGPETGWTVTQKALKTLSASGIREIVLIDAEGETALETGIEFSGSSYAKERAEGFVSSDFVLCRRDGSWSVRVEDREYELPELTAE